MRCAARAATPHTSAPTDTLADRVGVYVELHVEQGRALRPGGRPVAVASSIWPHGRWQFTFGGEANHAGTTRLVDRRDPMLTFASAVHAARTEAARHGASPRSARSGSPPTAPTPFRRRSTRGWTPAPPTRPPWRPRRGDPATPPRTTPARTDVTIGLSKPSRSPRSSRFPDAPRLRMQRGAGAVRRGSGAADRRGTRRRDPVGQGADGDVVRAQPDRRLALPRGVRRDRRLPHRRARRWPTSWPTGCHA